MAKTKLTYKDVFNMEIVGYTKPLMQELKPYYTKIMRGIKNAKGKIVFMSPGKFLDYYYEKHASSKEKITNPRIDINNLQYKWAIPFIDTVREKVMGSGRALHCEKEGIKEIPVLIVGRNLKEVDAWVKKEKIGKKTEK